MAALGAVLYELLTGVPPYSGVTALDVALAVIHKEAVAPRRLAPTVPAEIEAVCLKALDAALRSRLEERIRDARVRPGG